MGKEIAKITSCSTSWDDWSKKIYSVDASSYQIEPMVICAPANEFEVQAISKYASHSGSTLDMQRSRHGLTRSVSFKWHSLRLSSEHEQDNRDWREIRNCTARNHKAQTGQRT